jgi:hypothetical protein
MCQEWTQRDTEATQPRQEPEKEQPVWEKTSPRGNQELDDHDLDRGLERLESLVGH